MIYLDSNATSRIAPEVVEAMLPFLTEHFANPSSAYRIAEPVRNALRQAREQCASLIAAKPEEIIFTSCGTESNNTAIASALATHPERRHIVTTTAEHSAILEPCERLERRGDIEITRIPVDTTGLIDLEELRSAIRPGETALVSILWANNETGVINPIAEAAAIARECGALFHTDAVQAAGKIPIDLSATAIDLLSLSGHKFHAPKGVGLLFCSRRVRFQPLLTGGGQESGHRAGTENVASIVGMGEAAAHMLQHLGNAKASVRELRDHFENRLLNTIAGTEINGHPHRRLPTTSNLHLPGIDSAGLLILLNERNIFCSAGSACHAGALNASHVLSAMGFDQKRAAASIRFSFSRYNTMEEVDQAAGEVIACCDKMHSLRPPGDSPVIFTSRAETAGKEISS
jgi:cysteine desulfurase